VISVSLDAIADHGAPLDGLNWAELAALLARCVFIQSRIMAQIALAQPIDQSGATDTDPLLNARQAALRLGVSPAWVYRRAKQLPFTIHLGGQLKFSARGLEKFIGGRIGRMANGSVSGPAGRQGRNAKGKIDAATNDTHSKIHTQS
jgi:hypothetical protein